MTSLQSPQEFINAVRRAGVADADRLREFVGTARRAAVFNPRQMADLAVSGGLLTRFQADEVLHGRGDQLVVGEYQLLGRLGDGASGEVFLAEHSPTGQRRAVKVLHGERADDAAARRQLEREAAAVAALEHPNLVRVFEFDAGEADRPPFLAMEFVDGLNLQAAVALSGTFTAEAAAECGRQAALGLQHAWEAGLVHRDVKPANLLLARTGGLKVLDFGMVRFRRGSLGPKSFGRKLLGTVEYVAPEQITDGSTVDCRADVYALGGTLYFLLAGHPPFHGGHWADRLNGRLHADPPPIHHLRPDVPAELSAVIAAMLARRPVARPATPAAVAQLLAPFSTAGFANDLFARLDRSAVDDTIPNAIAITPTRPPGSDPVALHGATTELSALLHSPNESQKTVRLDRLPLVRSPARRPGVPRSRWSVGTISVVLVILLVAVVLTVVLLVS